MLADKAFDADEHLDRLRAAGKTHKATVKARHLIEKLLLQPHAILRFCDTWSP